MLARRYPGAYFNGVIDVHRRLSIRRADNHTVNTLLHTSVRQ